MKNLIAYLNFDGNTQEAMSFYANCLGGQLEVMPFPAEMGPGNEGRTMHSCISVNGTAVLMASDGQPGVPYSSGNNFAISIHCESLEEIERLFAAFGHNGKVTMPLGDQFWGARFGMLTDQFGIAWMFNCELPKP
jgi:PhnB protein